MLWLGCSSSKETSQTSIVNSAYRHVAYPQLLGRLDQVFQAYLEAAKEMDLNVVSVTPEQIEAVAKKGNPPTQVRIELGLSDTLETDVRVTTDYVMQ